LNKKKTETSKNFMWVKISLGLSNISTSWERPLAFLIRVLHAYSMLFSEQISDYSRVSFALNGHNFIKYIKIKER
jgi:hypothetical protein